MGTGMMRSVELQRAWIEQARLGASAFPPRCRDRTYFVPRLDWVLGDFVPWFEHIMVKVYGSSAWRRWRDCDDFARLYAVAMRGCHGQGEQERPTETTAVGPVRYGIGGHARAGHLVAALFVEEGRLVFVDPQMPGELLTLTDPEWDTIRERGEF